MPITDANTLKSWFQSRDKTEREQFRSLIDSLRHKRDKIPVADLAGLAELLSGYLQKKEASEPEVYAPAENYFFGAASQQYVSFANESSADPQFQSEGFYRLVEDAPAGESPETHPAHWAYQGAVWGELAIADVAGLAGALEAVPDKNILVTVENDLNINTLYELLELLSPYANLTYSSGNIEYRDMLLGSRSNSLVCWNIEDLFGQLEFSRPYLVNNAYGFSRAVRSGCPNVSIVVAAPIVLEGFYNIAPENVTVYSNGMLSMSNSVRFFANEAYSTRNLTFCNNVKFSGGSKIAYSGEGCTLNLSFAYMDGAPGNTSVIFDNQSESGLNVAYNLLRNVSLSSTGATISRNDFFFPSSNYSEEIRLEAKGIDDDVVMQDFFPAGYLLQMMVVTNTTSNSCTSPQFGNEAKSYFSAPSNLQEADKTTVVSGNSIAGTPAGDSIKYDSFLYQPLFTDGNRSLVVSFTDANSASFDITFFLKKVVEQQY